jgi:hypothetical protein
MKVDGEVVSPGAKAPSERDVRQQVLAWRDDQLVDVGIGPDDVGRLWLDDVGHVGIREMLAQRTYRRRGEYDVANLAQSDQQETGRIG